MTDSKQKELREPKSLSKVSGEILWHIEPSEQDIPFCRAVILDFIRRSGGVDCTPELTPLPPYSLEKVSHKRALLKCHSDSRQYYFKMFLPYFSWEWKRGPRIFSLPAVRQSVWFDRLREMGIGVVDLVGIAILPWKRQISPLQPISITITSSLLGADNLLKKITNNDLSLKQRTLIAKMTLSYAETLQKNMVGHIDMLPNNILYNAASDDVLLFDLDRFSRLRWWNRKRRIWRDNRKVIKLLRLVLS